MKLTILNYETGKVYQLKSIPSQEYIDFHFDGDWEEFLYKFCGKIYNSNCYYMTHKDEDVQMCEINDKKIEFTN